MKKLKLIIGIILVATCVAIPLAARADNNIMSHGLRTVVLDPQGRIFRQLDGNKWTPQELASAILEAGRDRPQVSQP
jgi:cytochrome oxidase Cu insertion factor (SCO1/SenC/PrrC family)